LLTPQGDTFTTMRKWLCFACLALLLGCTKPKATTPALTPETAAELLRYDHKADAWLTYVKNRQSAACQYKLNLPDQTTQPTEVDVQDIVFCGAAPASREFQAAVHFQYDAASGRWLLTRFSS